MNTSEPTPTSRAESLKNMLIKHGRYDEREPDIAISDLLTDIMHLVDANIGVNCECVNFNGICEWAYNNYTAEVDEMNTTKEAV